MLRNPVKGIDCGSRPLHCSRSSFPANPRRSRSSGACPLLAPEYHRESGRVGGFNPREVSPVGGGFIWRRLRGRLWRQAFLLFCRLPHWTRSCRALVDVDASHDAAGFLIGNLRVNAARGRLSPIRHSSLTAARGGLSRRSHSGLSSASFENEVRGHESCVPAEMLVGFTDAERLRFEILPGP